ncbi:MAG TPA: hypothetical protein VGF86_13320 [Candidatus Tumulicola sp.]|jgi:hypothetical protein
MRRALVAAVFLALATIQPARAATVTLLALPEHATIEPFGTRALMAVARDGRVAATVTVGGFRTQAIVWKPPAPRPRVAAARATIVGFDDAGALLLDAGRPRRLVGTRAVPIDTSYCEDFPQRSVGAVLAGILSNGAAVATMRSPAMVDLDDTSGRNAPVVLYLRSRRCLDMGNGIATATAGMFTAGYAAYIDNVPAPSNVVSNQERFTAMRWHERTPVDLGAGVALAVDPTGAAAGTDVPPGLGASYGGVTHARYWPPTGSAVEIAPNAPVSAAYAVDRRNRVAGMLEDPNGRHYAFLWSNGTLRRLDDLVATPGWRFECAYAFTPAGGVAGIGTYRGKAAAFVVYGL